MLTGEERIGGPLRVNREEDIIIAIDINVIVTI